MKKTNRVLTSISYTKKICFPRKHSDIQTLYLHHRNNSNYFRLQYNQRPCNQMKSLQIQAIYKRIKKLSHHHHYGDYMAFSHCTRFMGDKFATLPVVWRFFFKSTQEDNVERN